MNVTVGLLVTYGVAVVVVVTGLVLAVANLVGDPLERSTRRSRRRAERIALAENSDYEAALANMISLTY